ncbi:hypothetical protein IWZ01DRAFT_351626 [Phyllosticta capitalensis]
MASLQDDVDDDQMTANSSDWIKPILKKDYDIELDMPEDRLFPTPSRALYVRWIASLLNSTDPSWYENFDPESSTQPCPRREEIAGLDIGTGASAIYPLLALRLHPQWFMYATEIDATSLRYAHDNLVANKLDDRCRLLQRTPTQPFMPDADKLGRQHLDFVMTNPPFFASVQEWQASLSGTGKEKPPDSVCTGARTEMVYEGEGQGEGESGGGGGDYDFALRLYRESAQAEHVKAQWYSVMFGKKQSAQRFVAHLQTAQCLNFATFLLGAANRTRRWVVAWSWLEFRPESSISRTESAPPSLNPWPTDYSILNQSRQSTQRVQEEVMRILSELPPPFEMKWNQTLGSGVCRTTEILWNRSYRRRAKLIAEGKVPPRSQQEISESKKKPVGLGVEIAVEEERVLVRWKQGSQRVWFESFCGYVHEQLRPLMISGASGSDRSTKVNHAAGTGTTSERGTDTSPSQHHHGSSTKGKSTPRSEDESIGQADDSTRKRRKIV